MRPCKNTEPVFTRRKFSQFWIKDKYLHIRYSTSLERARFSKKKRYFKIYLQGRQVASSRRVLPVSEKIQRKDGHPYSPVSRPYNAIATQSLNIHSRAYLASVLILHRRWTFEVQDAPVFIPSINMTSSLDVDPLRSECCESSWKFLTWFCKPNSTLRLWCMKA